MSVTFVVALVVVVAAAMVTAPMLFGRPQPATVPVERRGRTAPRRPRPLPYEDDRIRLRWWHRARAGGILAALVVVLAAATSVVIGVIVFAVGLALE